MTATLISPSGNVLHHRARLSTTPSEEAEAKAVRIWLKKEARLEENRRHARNRNVKAFLRALNDAGLYRITLESWCDKGFGKMGLTDFSDDKQDLVAVEILRGLDVIDRIAAGDLALALARAGNRWTALATDEGYAGFAAAYGAFGGTLAPGVPLEKFDE